MLKQCCFGTKNYLMDFVLSYEKTKIRLLVKPLFFSDLSTLIKPDQMFQIHELSIWLELPLKTTEECFLTEISCAKGLIPFKGIEQCFNDCFEIDEKYEIDFDKLSQDLKLSEAISEKEILADTFKRALMSGGLVNLKISSDYIEIKYYEDAEAFCFSFSDESKLKEFVDLMPSKMRDNQYMALKEAVRNRKLLATGEFENKLKKTGASNRIESIIQEYQMF